VTDREAATIACVQITAQVNVDLAMAEIEVLKIQAEWARTFAHVAMRSDLAPLPGWYIPA
jgi:hypothetical protein